MSNSGVYHETQELYRCGIHALNNVLQGGSVYELRTYGACSRMASHRLKMLSRFSLFCACVRYEQRKCLRRARWMTRVCD